MSKHEITKALFFAILPLLLGMLLPAGIIMSDPGDPLGGGGNWPEKSDESVPTQVKTHDYGELFVSGYDNMGGNREIYPSKWAGMQWAEEGSTPADGSEKEQTCRNIVINSQLNVDETGSGTGTAKPWFYLKPVIYYFKEGDGSDLAYDGYSLLLPDGDDGDPSPTSDILGQIVTFDNKLESVTVTYQRVMIDSNPTDKVYGELWLLTAEGGIDLDNPEQYRVTRWTVSDSEKAWAKEEVPIDEALFDDLSGQDIALLLRTETDGGGATEAEMEWVLFDDVEIVNCVEPEIQKNYLPLIRGE